MVEVMVTESIYFVSDFNGTWTQWSLSSGMCIPHHIWVKCHLEVIRGLSLQLVKMIKLVTVQCSVSCGDLCVSKPVHHSLTGMADDIHSVQSL